MAWQGAIETARFLPGEDPFSRHVIGELAESRVSISWLQSVSIVMGAGFERRRAMIANDSLTPPPAARPQYVLRQNHSSLTAGGQLETPACGRRGYMGTSRAIPKNEAARDGMLPVKPARQLI